MKKQLILLVLLALAGCAATKARPDGSVLIPPEVMAQCAIEGGCTLFSAARLKEIVDEAFELGVVKGREGSL